MFVELTEIYGNKVEPGMYENVPMYEVLEPLMRQAGYHTGEEEKSKMIAFVYPTPKDKPMKVLFMKFPTPQDKQEFINAVQAYRITVLGTS